jgi:SET domain-containing protein
MDAFRFEVARSLIDGRGLFSLSVIPERRKIGELGGEIISLREARTRARHSGRVMIVEFGDGTALDALRGGTELRYIKHSCSPNTYMRLAGRRVEFYSLRQIGPGEELTCDYGVTHHNGARRCGCRRPKCRGWI